MSRDSFYQRPSDLRDRRPIGFIGSVLLCLASITGINENPQAKQVTTIAIPASPDADTDYMVTTDGVGVVVNSASQTQAQLGAALVDAHNAKPSARARMIASYAGGTLTLTGVWPGVASVVSTSGGAGGGEIGAATTATAAAEAAVVEFGRVVVSDGTVTDEACPKVFVPTTADFTAQVISLTFAGAAGAYYTGEVEVNGKRYPWGGVVWDTDLNTTCTAIAAAINAVLPAETVIAASVGSGGGVVTLTAEVEGAEFDAAAWASGATAAEATKAYTTGPSVATSVRRALVGLSCRRLDVENQTVGGDDPAYAANAGVEVLTRGTMVVQRDTTETWARGDELYVSLASATKGRLYDTAGTDRVWLGRAPIVVDRSEHSTTADGLGVIRLDMGA